MKEYYIRLISYSILKYFSVIGSMAAFMLSSILVEQNNSASDNIFLCVISYTLGLYCGDPNSLIFFQRKFRENIDNVNNGYWIPRLALTLIISAVSIFFVEKLEVSHFLLGSIFAYFLPQGRISNANKFQIVIFLGGLIKITISIFIIVNSRSAFSNLPILICLATSSNYLASIIYHLIYIKNDIINNKSTNNINVLHEFLECCKSFSITLPIHFYTSLGGFAYINIKGEEGISLYFLYDRIIRGLGATVNVFQSKTMDAISKISLKIETIKISNLIKYFIIYLAGGFIIGILFVILGKLIFNYIGINSNIFDNNLIEIIPVAVSSMYISNLIGVQIFMVNNNYRIMFFASIIAIISFYISLLYSNNILLMISVPEISIAVFLFYCLKFKLKH
ncbi:hypothetical protein [Polynucleobacter corsicus]|uniref:hypothetical protein n=1 Tax=Polynucleobacter corsicus TaxID=2081042 RepID=UPI001BFEE36D|nr:hypothetical protein [Polynucleobacter corsicus]